MQLFEWGIASNASGQPGLHVVGITGSAPGAQARMLTALDAVPAGVLSRGWVTRLALGTDRQTYDRLATFVRVSRDAKGAVRWLPGNSHGAARPAEPQPPTRTIAVDGHRLLGMRRARGLSRERLAWDAGVSITTLARLESQPRPMCLSRTLSLLAEVLGENPRALVCAAPPAEG
jgi:DNA-binding XRE family transcriptional regulator